MRTRGLLFSLDVGIEPFHCHLHGAGTLHHLRQEHLSLAEQLSDAVDALHERAVDNGNGAAKHLVSLSKHIGNAVGDSAFNHARQSRHGVDRGIDSSACRLLRHFFANKAACHFNKRLGGIGMAAQNHVFDGGAQFGRHIVVRQDAAGIHNCHIHAARNGMVEKHRVHGLAHIVVASERKRQVAHTAANLCSRQILLNPLHCKQEVKSIAFMLLDACGNGEYIRVENNVLRVEIDAARCENVVGAAAYGNLAVESVGLSVFVECHHHHRSAHLPDVACMGNKLLLAVFQADAVYDAFARNLLQRLGNHAPVR